MRVRAGRIDVACDLEGPATAPVVALGHCYCANRDLWRDQREALLQGGYRVLTHDVRGHGESASPPPPYTLQDMAEDIVAVLDALQLEKVHYCGISMSGMIAQWLAINHEERLSSLILANTSSAYSSAQRAGWEQRMATLASDGPQALLDGAMSRWFTAQSLASNAHGVEMLRRGFLTMEPATRLAIMRNIASVDTTARLPEISIPTLVIIGALDEATPPADGRVIAAAVAESRLVTLEDAGHISATEQPDAFNHALLAFLETRR